MNTVVKTFMVVYLVLLGTFTCTGIITATIDAKNADTYAASTVSAIEASNFAQPVIDAWTTSEDVTNRNYRVTVDSMDMDGDGKIDMAKVTLKYDFTISFLNETGKEHVVIKYAR